MSTMRHHLFWGLLLGLSEMTCIQILTWTGFGLSHLTWILTYGLVITFSIFAGYSLEKRAGQRLRVSQASVLMLVLILVSRLIYQTYMFVYITYVDPAWVETVVEVWSEQLRQGGADASTIAANIAQFRREWETVHVFTYGLVNYGIAQFVLGLLAVTAVVCKPWRRGRD